MEKIVVVRQAEGKFGLFDKNRSRIIAYNLTEKELVKLWGKMVSKKAEEEMKLRITEAKGVFPEPTDAIEVEEALKKHSTHLADPKEKKWDKKMLKEITT